MSPYNNIIVIIDPAEDNQTALLKAEKLAAVDHGSITLFCSGYNGALAQTATITGETVSRTREAFVKRLDISLKEKATALIDKGFNVKTVAVWEKHPSEAIMQFLEHHGGDLVIKTTHHQNVMQRTFYSHTDWDLIRYCNIPLLLTKSTVWPNKSLNITVAVDPVNAEETAQNLDSALLTYAVSLADSLKAHLDVLHVYDPTPLLIYMDQPALDAGDITEQIRAQHLEALSKLVAPYNIKDTRVHLETGNPSTMIPDHLYQNDTHIVVMGATSRKGFDRWLIGHTAERILDRISADILVIKAREDQTA
jgi:universal stress protein E